VRVGIKLTDADEFTHPIGPASNWNESRYVDFWDARQRVGGWFRIGNRPNEGRAEMSACAYLPDGTVGFMFDRPTITGNEMVAGDQRWGVTEPWRSTTLSYKGPLAIMNDPWLLNDPKRAFTTSEHRDADIELTSRAFGLESVMGSDQDHIDLIFLPGQADFHYQHLVHTTGTVRVGDESWTVDGLGGKDHSWGPRNWHAKIYLRWLIASVDDDTGFILVRAVGRTKATRSGFYWDRGTFHIVDDFDMRNTYADAPHQELRRVELTMRAGDRSWSASGVPQQWLPVRHRQPTESGELVTLRIVKSPTDWVFGDGRTGAGHCEYHDLMVDGRPVGLDD
jgi:hypothetical protein